MPLRPPQLLKAYLTSRQQYVRQCLADLQRAAAQQQAAQAPDPAALQELVAVLGGAAGAVCDAVAQAGELFLALPGVSRAPLLLTVRATLARGAPAMAGHGHARRAVCVWWWWWGGMPYSTTNTTTAHRT